MTETITIEDAQARLRDLIHQLTPGDEVIITENQQSVAKLVIPETSPDGDRRPPPGLGKGMIEFIAPDFDAPLEEMQEYME